MNFALFYFSYSTPVPAWSCTWNDYDTNYIYCGLQNGTCLIFDVRNTDTYLKSIQSATGGSCPVISVAHVSPDPHGALRWDALSSIWFIFDYMKWTQAQTKELQHFDATYCNIGYCWLKFENGQIFHAQFVDVAWCCSHLARFVQQCCSWTCALVQFSTLNMYM